MSVSEATNQASAAVNGSARIRALVSGGVPGMADPLKWRADTFTDSMTTIRFEAFPDVMRAYRAYAGHCKARGVTPEDAYAYIRSPWSKLGLWARQGLTFAYFKECFWDAADVKRVRSWADTRRQVVQVFAQAHEHMPRRHRGIVLDPGQVTFRELLRSLDREGYRQVNSGDLRRYVLDPLERDGLLVVERPERRGQAGRLYLTVAPETALEHLERIAARIGAEHEVERARNVLDGQVRAKRREARVARALAERDAVVHRQRQAQIEAAAYAREHPPMFHDLTDVLTLPGVGPAATAGQLRALAATRASSVENSYDEPAKD